MSSYLLKNCNVVNFEQLNFKTGDIFIQNGRIEKIGEGLQPLQETVIMDCGGKLALPAFVDAHTHMTQTFLRGPMDDYNITDWLVRMFTITGDLMTEEDVYYSALLGCLEALRFGTTTINEMCDFGHRDVMVQAFKDAGIRATIGTAATDIAENEKTPVLSVDTCLKRLEDLYHQYHGTNDGLISVSSAPPGLPACSKNLMQALKQYTREKGLVFHTHLAEGKKETEDVKRMTGLSGEGEALYQFGILDEKTLLAHSIWLEDEELDRMKETGANPVHCPSTNMKISDGIPKIQQMLDRNINVCMGCDGEASSSNRDLIREARLGSFLQKAITRNPAAMNATQTFNMMTRNGAKALGHKDLGELKEGYQADVLLVDAKSQLELANKAYQVNNLLYAGTGYGVDTVFVKGKLMVRGGILLGHNVPAVVEKCEQLWEKLNKKISLL